MSIAEKFGKIIRCLIEGSGPSGGIARLLVAEQFTPDGGGPEARARSLNAAFLLLLAGPSASRYEDARRYMAGARGSAAEFLSAGAGLILREVSDRYESDPGFQDDFDALYDLCAGGGAAGPSGNRDAFWRLFFPEGIMEGGHDACRDALREKRSVRLSGLNGSPVVDPGREVLFTSNVLVTLPAPGNAEGLDDLDPGTLDALRAAGAEPRLYWYDHPIPVGAKPGENELLYCLGRLSEGLRIEETAGMKEPGRNIDCVLSVSVTHRGLHGVVRPWLRSELAREDSIGGMNLHVFTEDDTDLLLNEILLPAGRRWLGDFDGAPLGEVFGVDGEYGRHYSFLKAIARFWNVFVSPEIRATFKIDLDQVFPQEELLRETGATAFRHLCSPLWGARGVDSRGEGVYLGMIAGALVNRRDIGCSIFTPDVMPPGRPPEADEALFWSAIPQALSTEAEMMERYGEGMHRDGVTGALQRVHVTGGTNGVLVEALKRYRPFTPSCIGRAEDQAYLLSALYGPPGMDRLRYVHQPGLIMRHDAELFSAAAAAAKTGKLMGDILRVLLFSLYARALPWPVGLTKEAMDPFTGCFISRIPITIALLRFSLRAAKLFDGGGGEGELFFDEGVRRLSEITFSLASGVNPIEGIYLREKSGWDLFHGIMDQAEEKIAAGDPFAASLAERARRIVRSLRIDT